MSDSFRRMRANRRIEGQPCRWCRAPLALGEDVVGCQACGSSHHAACWEGKAGCASAECVNAPLEQLAEPAAPVGDEKLPMGKARCPHCNAIIRSSATVCPQCRRAASPDGIYHGPKTNAPGAVASMVCGIIGLVICGLILGVVAIVQSNKARQLIARDPSFGGGGFAMAGLVLGIIGIVGWAVVLMARLGSM